MFQALWKWKCIWKSIRRFKIAFEKAISARKKLFLDAFNEFNERLKELKRLLKKNIRLEEMYKYFPEVGYMEKSVIERYKVWENN